MWYSFTDFCPHNNQERTIEIKYAEIIPNDYKKLEFECKDYFDCKCLDEYDRCPLYIKAPDIPI